MGTIFQSSPIEIGRFLCYKSFRPALRINNEFVAMPSGTMTRFATWFTMPGVITCPRYGANPPEYIQCIRVLYARVIHLPSREPRLGAIFYFCSRLLRNIQQDPTLLACAYNAILITPRASCNFLFLRFHPVMRFSTLPPQFEGKKLSRSWIYTALQRNSVFTSARVRDPISSDEISHNKFPSAECWTMITSFAPLRTNTLLPYREKLIFNLISLLFWIFLVLQNVTFCIMEIRFINVLILWLL